MKVRFWGVRGSIPCPGRLTAKYGGNTACIELRLNDPERLIIIDAGSGIRELGNFMMVNDLPKGPISASIYLSHTHWDHIMGLPFFTPIYLPSTTLQVFGPVNHETETLDTIVGGQMTYRYFPVREAELAANISYANLKAGHFDLGDGVSLTTKYLNHPILCLGYRFECRGKVFCTAYDTEPYRNLFCTDPNDPAYDELMASEGQAVAEEQGADLERFVAGADLLVYDAQYTRQEFAAKLGWGHTAIEEAIAVAGRNGVKRLALFHHDPMRTDEQLDAMGKVYGQSPEAAGREIFFAQEGMEIEI
ncbi:MAG: MBL fold metallo-hydrolase [Desulfobacteraceae bacterium]|nr:MBL fold metallo-hydrolase [Desulfobacteraceae bacterium]